MNNFLLIILFIILQSCAKHSTVLICGDHICVNKKEARQYFEENLSLEVKIIDNVKQKRVDLVELNLKKDSQKKEINIFKKNTTKKEVKILSSKEIDRIKKNIKKKEKNKKIVQKKIKKKDKNFTSINDKKINNRDRNVANKSNNVIDVCTILDKCSIDEISKYLIKLGNKRDFPDITIRGQKL